MTKENKKKTFLIFLGLLLLMGWFYWFQYRPVRIRHDCSWVKHHKDAIPERPAMTEEKLKAKGMLKDYSHMQNDSKYYEISEKENKEFNSRRLSILEAGNKEIIEEYKHPKPAEPAKDWWEKASKKEYDFCLHSRGLE